ncbi:hypothetical protein C8Q80DRAFT_1155986 [Daedaleopsis nitida]|nr:hypothetical protein C8Q80DRAFT_1155986 [Daedaleopsis nitida]
MKATCTMHDLAAELLEQIYTLACTDGGYTGCSLSLVSKHVREASRSARFHSISLTSGIARQLDVFLQCFYKERSAAAEHEGERTPIVRHLCIAAADGKDEQHSWCYRRTYMDPELDTTCETAIELEHQQYTTDLISFLQLAAPNLYTLSLVHWQGWQRLTMLHDIECAGFPLLQELTIAGPDPFIPKPDASLPLYPRVARLHLADKWGGFTDFPRWADGGLSPNVTHLRLSNLGHIPIELMAFVEHKKNDKFPHLTRFLIQPRGPPAPGGRCGNPYIQYDVFQSALAHLHAFAALPVEQLPDKEVPCLSQETWEEIAKREWLDRLEGGPGCWAAPATSCTA